MKDALKPSLKELWEVSGVDYDDFKEVIGELTSCTTLTQYSPFEVVLMSFCTEDKEAFFVDGHYYARDAKGEIKVLTRNQRLKKEKLAEKSVPADIIEEFRRNKLMLLLGRKDNKITAFTSPNLIGTLGQKLNLSGLELFEPNFERDAYFAKVLSKRKAPINIVSRKIGDCTKVFAAFSDEYPYIPQTILLDIKDKISGRKDLGNAVCKGWRVNHSTSALYLEFPDFAADVSKMYNLPDVITPGVILMTSDVGDCSVSCIGTWNVKGSRVVQSVYKRRHRGVVTSAGILSEIDKEVFQAYRKLPGRLADLLTIDISDPRDAIEYMIKKSDIESVGKKVANAIQKGMIAELNPALKYTAYDLVCNLMSVPSRLSGVKEEALKKLEEKVMKAAFLKWETFNKSQKSVPVLSA